MKKNLRHNYPFLLGVPFLCIVIIFISASCTYQKMNPAPDVDKGPPAPAPPAVDNSCWMATASNMLAGAGYGTGNTVQQRSDDIYADMVAQYGKADRGWPDAALQWWLTSANNTWTNNPYTVVSVQGTKSANPWNNQNIPQIVGKDLRECHYVGLVFSWPTDAVDTGGNPIVGVGGHATTAWGDNLGKGTLSINPTEIRMTDSDRDAGGDIQVYAHDVFNNPNPGGPNEGNGLYFDYSNPHPYIRCIVMLSPTDDPSDNKQTQIVIGTYKIHQSKKLKATDLHYKVGTDTQILSYKTEIDWDEDLTPTIVESQPNRTELTVDWDLSDNSVPFCTWVTITTEFVLPAWNAIEYEDVHYTYPEGVVELKFSDLRWALETPKIEEANRIQDVTGGYVIGGFEIVNPEVNENNGLVAEYRFIHQYLYDQDPELHHFFINGQKGFYVTNLRFGHTYGILTSKELWKFENWMTKIKKKIPLERKGHELKIDWEGRLPYPKGIDIRDALKFIKQEKPNKRK